MKHFSECMLFINFENIQLIKEVFLNAFGPFYRPDVCNAADALLILWRGVWAYIF